MSGTSYAFNKSIASDLEDLKKIQIQRDKLEKATFDYKSKSYILNTLTAENVKLKQALDEEVREKYRLDHNLAKKVQDYQHESEILTSELDITQSELEKYIVYADEIEKNNNNWRRECEKQSLALEELVEEAEGLSSKLKDAEEELYTRKEELNKAKSEKHSYLQLKSALDRQKHNYQILETDYKTFKKQNEDLKVYIEGLEEERIRAEGALGKLKSDAEDNHREIEKEVEHLTDELENNRSISNNQEQFIEELRAEIDLLRKQNVYLKNKLDLLN